MRIAVALTVFFFILQGCGSTVSASHIIVVDTLDSQHGRSCMRKRAEEKINECIFGEAKNWRIEVSIGPGPPGMPGAHIFLPDAGQVLDVIVSRCRLGKAFLQSATDGQAMLWIGSPGLTAQQSGCVRSMERPGLRLVKEE
ncbi:hypothetical protein [Sphingomonas sp.]|uniref:hypothetical protein n=1 Tax=Sphingomonas sp. TaxID=28214 RepID=UPI002D7EB324|nr:hypothetical protein [Sphingomonas sp.]HEU0043527.1 hypothetical protein [Sphingomonas sp.]